MSFRLGPYHRPPQSLLTQHQHGSYAQLQKGLSLSRGSQPSTSDPFEAVVPYDSDPTGHHTQGANSSAKEPKSLIPLPDWPDALGRWGVWWELHIYGFAVLFLILTLMSVAIFVRFRPRVQKCKIVYNTLLLLATSGVFRAVFMLVDPYGYSGRMAGLMVGIMMQGVYPLFCACYGLTQVMLLRITKVDVGNSKVRSLSWLMGCTLTYLFLVVVIESLVSFERSLKLLLLLDSGCFIAWALYLGITFICSGFRLSQYATETKRARKELNAFSNNRRSASNAAGLIGGASSPHDNGINVFNVDVMQATSDATPGAGQESTDAIISDYTFYLPTIPANSHRTSSNLRLSRPRLKISERDHMMVTIATDEDDVSTSSTDVENVKDDGAAACRTKKRYKHAQKTKRSRSGSKTPTSTTSYTPVSLSEEKSRKKQSVDKSVGNCTGNNAGSSTSLLRGERTLSQNCLHNNSGLCTVESLHAYSIACQGGSSPFQPAAGINCLSKEKISDECRATAEPELPLLKPPTPSAENAWSSLSEATKREEPDSLDDDPNDDSDMDDDQRRMESYKTAMASVNSAPARDIPEPPDLTLGEGTDFQAENTVDDMGERSCCAANSGSGNSVDARHALGQPDVTYASNLDPEHLSSSPRDNGYLADTENIFYCSSFPKPCHPSGRPTLARDETPRTSGDLSSQRSTPSHSDDESTISPDLSERMRTIMPAALGLFRIRQSKVVQKAVHLTYFLTFLFMFACLLQLYTVFGVYGVLGTIPRPDPWPWLIFHTIFRATEFSIGLTTAFIAFFTLNHRHQRAKRRQLQQHHLDATRDCIV